ncbi:MAG TPA: imidazoleglycerol-phosphate dehydratase HisB [Deltaproteobacteria bacterium]|nr:MAG: imidazoleglycerol-phosphate dehydratase [Deltaproteobacteria bacterium GWA2_55_82]OGQ62284.1 MAG: imidazoleglycerol-phosphate dehydratase [Deltaproteobacteria bacterium RIFCSPLOWO2_02_FULL_55_12]OIJ74396.1 MAG: imidazoleglycerol-phosphate dehydratase [Deltaproteobacteria bacterium GWC2_55_46]HBG47045.1 imidazoleglycerol-phosphate dehydratase HisB [Deltaproteobacteria bacterium]HCY10895.1 imidazoleglycerol-phosphate dehydratase HisB [Deltaproteobacteria bacterium]
MARKAKIARKTRETEITVEVNLDGSGKADVKTPLPFFDHMLTNFARHGLIDLKLRAKGDVEVDFHHTVEDAGISLGEAVKKALGDNSGIRRCATSTVPMMDALSTVVLDISNRPYFKFNSEKAALSQNGVYSSLKLGSVEKTFDVGLMKEFMKALSNSAGLDLHITLHYGEDIHHAIESVYKALGRALGSAVSKDPRIKGVLSTKGKL